MAPSPLEKTMSHYTMDYSTLPEGEKRIAKALKDCKDWLGTQQYRKIIRIIKADNGRTPRNLLMIGLALRGIQGYPAEVMIDEFWSPQRSLFD